VQIAVE